MTCSPTSPDVRSACSPSSGTSWRGQTIRAPRSPSPEADEAEDDDDELDATGLLPPRPPLPPFGPQLLRVSDSGSRRPEKGKLWPGKPIPERVRHEA
jgi:hypothetical protein